MASKGVALVTGAGQGIGRAIALRLAEDGYDVAINDISQTNLEQVAQEIRAKQRKAAVHVADVAVEEQVATMVKKVVEEFGSLDVMVANAGIVRWKPLVETTEEEWDAQFNVNAKGVFFCYKHAGKQMMTQERKGKMIAASSIAGKQGSAGASAYCATKFAVRGLTQAAAAEFGPHGITVNAYAPGFVKTPLLEYLSAQAGGDVEEIGKTQAPLRRIAQPEDIANLVSFLASSDSSFITGQSISTNGGLFFD